MLSLHSNQIVLFISSLIPLHDPDDVLNVSVFVSNLQEP
jgi:hypothetical protein